MDEEGKAIAKLTELLGKQKMPQGPERFQAHGSFMRTASYHSFNVSTTQNLLAHMMLYTEVPTKRRK